MLNALLQPDFGPAGDSSCAPRLGAFGAVDCIRDEDDNGGAPIPKQKRSSPYQRFTAHPDVADALVGKPHEDAREDKTESTPPLHLSFNLAAVSDYRRAGATRSDHHAALQGGVDVSIPSGWSAGVFASSIAYRRGAHSEVDLYAAKSFALGRTDLSLGATAIFYPGGAHTDYGYVQATASRAIGPVDATLAVVYGWPQANLDDEEGLYVGVRARTPAGRLAGVPLTLGASLGRASGGFTFTPSKVDWSLSLTADLHGIDIGVAYVDTDTRDRRGSPAAVFSIRRRF